VAEFVKAASLADVPPGSLLGVELGDDETKVCVANVEGEIYAFQDRCSHKDFPLSNGELVDCQVQCAWHGARFDIKTGRALSLPAVKPIRTYEVKVEDGTIYVAV